jgi:GNAT superfamily N-acetyltransferase
MTAPARVRRASVADLEEVLALWSHFIRVHRDNPAFRQIPRDALARRREAFRTLIEGPDSAVYVVERPDGGLDAMLACCVEENSAYFHPPRYARIQVPFVRPDARGRGHLRRLLDAAYRWAREMELTEVRLYTSALDRTSNRLADDLGFEPILVVRRRPIAWDYPPTEGSEEEPDALL